MKKILSGIVFEDTAHVRPPEINTPIISLEVPVDWNGGAHTYILDLVIKHFFMGKHITIIEGDAKELIKKAVEEKEYNLISDEELAKAIGVR